MMYFDTSSYNTNRENYEMLAAGIITQAVRDYENGLELKRILRGKDPRNDRERKIEYTAVDAENFFHSQWFIELARSKDIDGDAILERCRKNFYKYGKCIFSVEDWEKIRAGKPISKRHTRQTIYSKEHNNG